MEKYKEAWSWTPDHKQKLKSSDHIFLATRMIPCTSRLPC